MRTILSRVILERVSSPREGWRKNKEGGGRASQERRSTFRGKAKWSTKLGYETRRSYFLWRVPLWLAKTGKKTLPLRSFAPLTILWIVRALASSYSSCSLSLCLFISLSLRLVNIQSTKYYERNHFSKQGTTTYDWSIEERDFGVSDFSNRKDIETCPLLFVTEMENVNGWKGGNCFIYI